MSIASYGAFRYDLLQTRIENAIANSFLLFTDKTLMTNPRFFKKIYEGKGFSISKRFESVASDGSVDVLFSNPSNSGVSAYIVFLGIVSMAQAWIDIYRGNSVSASGTAITPVDLNFGSSNTSAINVEYNGTYTTGTLVHNTVVPGGTSIRAVGAASEVGESVIIPENRNFLVRVTNKSASATDLSVRIIWWEE